MYLLPVETGFFPGVLRKASQGLMHRKSMRNCGKMHWSESKGLPSGAQCLIPDQVSQLHLTAGEVQPLGPQTHRPTGQGPKMRNFCVSHFPICSYMLPRPDGARATAGPVLGPMQLLQRERVPNKRASGVC